MHGRQLFNHVLKSLPDTLLRMLNVVSVFNMGLLLQTFSVNICVNIKRQLQLKSTFCLTNGHTINFYSI